MSKIHSLLVGINNYASASKVTSLQGCINDITKFHNYMIDNFSNRLSEPQILLNQAATKQTILTE